MADRCLYPRLTERSRFSGLGSTRAAKAARVLPGPEVKGLWMTTALVAADDMPADRPRLCNPEDVADMVRNIAYRPVEEVLFIPLDTEAKPLGVVRIGQGDISESIVTVGEAARAMLLAGSERGILVHNHPSGNAALSRQDKMLARRLSQGLRLIQGELLDSIVVTRDDYVSMAETVEM